MKAALSTKQRACKPASVWFRALQENLEPFPSFIWSLYHCRLLTTYPPASDEQSSTPVYMVFQLIRCTAPGVTTGTGELLPHLFTLIPTFQEKCRDGSFLLHFYTLADIFPLGSMMLCADRTFLPSRRQGDGTACCTAKVVILSISIKILVTFVAVKVLRKKDCLNIIGKV
jgi:hypothetical protein